MALIFLKIADLKNSPTPSQKITAQIIIFMKTAAMSQSKKILLGIFSMLPIIFFVVYMVSFLGLFLDIFREAYAHRNNPEDAITPTLTNLAGIIIAAVLLGILSLAVLVYFIVHAINNQQINSNERIIWVLIFIFIGMITFPIYWYTRIWKTPVQPITI